MPYPQPCQNEGKMNTKMALDHLSPVQIDRLHHAALNILAETGVIVSHQGALELLTAAGATIDGQRVRISAEMVDAALASAPKSIDVYDRLGRVVMRLGGRNAYFGTGSDLPFTFDPDTGEHRRSGKRDVARIARLCDGLENVDFCMSMGIASDASPVTSYVHQFDAMVRSTAKPVVFTANNAADMQDIFDLGRCGRRRCGRADRSAATTCSTTSPSVRSTIRPTAWRNSSSPPRTTFR